MDNLSPEKPIRDYGSLWQENNVLNCIFRYYDKGK